MVALFRRPRESTKKKKKKVPEAQLARESTLMYLTLDLKAQEEVKFHVPNKSLYTARVKLFFSFFFIEVCLVMMVIHALQMETA